MQMNADTVTLSPNYELEVPAEIREALQLKAGEQFRVLQYAGRVEFMPVRSVQSMRGFLAGMDTHIERDDL